MRIAETGGKRDHLVTYDPRRGWRHRAHLAVAAGVLLIGAAVVLTHPPSYYASSTVAFVGSQTVFDYEVATQIDVDGRSESPLARFHDPTVVGDIFLRLYQSRAKQEALEAQGFDGRLTVSTRRTVLSTTPDHGPILVLTVMSSTPEAALRGARLAVNDVINELQSQQNGYIPDLTVGLTVISLADSLPAPGSRMRSAAGFSLLALVLGVAVRRVAKRQHTGARSGGRRMTTDALRS